MTDVEGVKEPAGASERFGAVENGAHATARAPGGAWRTPAASWVALVSPGRAAAMLGGARAFAFVVTFLLYLVCWSASIVFLAMWEDTVQVSWGSPPITASAPSSTFVWGSPELTERSFAEVWDDWHGKSLISAAEMLFGAVLLAYVAAVGITAWLYLPLVYAGGGLGASYFRSFRAVSLMQIPVQVGTALIGGIIVTAIHWGAHAQVSGVWGVSSSLQWRELTPPATLAAICFLAWWLERGMRGARPGIPNDLPPMCEGCGYDLTHAPVQGRCSECGRAVADSLVAEGRRMGSRWENRSHSLDPLIWIRDTYAVLCRPAEFYGGLRLRATEKRQYGFAALHLVLLGCATLIWASIWMTDRVRGYEPAGPATWGFLSLALLGASITALAVLFLAGGGTIGLASSTIAFVGVMLVYVWISWAEGNSTLGYSGRNRTADLVLFVGMSFFLPQIVGWILHRFVAAAPASWWFFRRMLPAPQYVSRIANYEIAFVWIPWFYVMCMISSYIAWNGWISELLGRRWTRGGIPFEVHAVVWGVVFLCLAWLNRYRVAMKAVRWANF